MHKCLAYTPYYIQHSEYSNYEPGQKLRKLALQLVLLKSASSAYSRQLGSQLLHKNMLYAIVAGYSTSRPPWLIQFIERSTYNTHKELP